MKPRTKTTGKSERRPATEPSTAAEVRPADRPDPYAGMSPRLRRLAEEQGVKPVQRFEDLLGDFWPEDESIDDFLAWLDRERGRAAKGRESHERG